MDTIYIKRSLNPTNHRLSFMAFSTSTSGYYFGGDDTLVQLCALDLGYQPVEI